MTFLCSSRSCDRKAGASRILRQSSFAGYRLQPGEHACIIRARIGALTRDPGFRAPSPGLALRRSRHSTAGRCCRTTVTKATSRCGSRSVPNELRMPHSPRISRKGSSANAGRCRMASTSAGGRLALVAVAQRWTADAADAETEAASGLECLRPPPYNERGTKGVPLVPLSRDAVALTSSASHARRRRTCSSPTALPFPPARCRRAPSPCP